MSQGPADRPNGPPQLPRVEASAESLSAAPRWHGVVFGAAWGVAIFVLSRQLEGHVEPWDGLPSHYALALVLGGVVAAVVLRTKPGALWLGLVLGQQGYVVFVSSHGAGNLWPIGMAFGMCASLLAVVGWWIGSTAKRRIGLLMPSSRPRR